ncbi:hypothetical protein T11_1359, partial [Trichinella zimbabwensis]
LFSFEQLRRFLSRTEKFSAKESAPSFSRVLLFSHNILRTSFSRPVPFFSQQL